LTDIYKYKYKLNKDGSINNMAVFQYECDSCEKEFELVCKIDDRDKFTDTPCAYCGGKIYRVIPVTNFHLHGHGWARDGYQKAVGKMKTRSEAQRDYDSDKKRKA
jgi:putative FmdB family regulatory protein